MIIELALIVIIVIVVITEFVKYQFPSVPLHLTGQCTCRNCVMAQQNRMWSESFSEDKLFKLDMSDGVNLRYW